MRLVIYLGSAVLLLACATSGKKCRTPITWVLYKDNFKTAAPGWSAEVFCNTLKEQILCRFSSQAKANAAELTCDESRVYPVEPEYTLRCETGPTTDKQLIPSVILTPTVTCKSANSWQPYEKFIALGSDATADVYCDADMKQTHCRFPKKQGSILTAGSNKQNNCVFGFKCGCHKEGSSAIPWMQPVE